MRAYPPGRAAVRRPGDRVSVPRIRIKGAGVAGLAVAQACRARGFEVEVVDVAGRIGGGASWLAGGMLAPWCESETGDPLVLSEGRTAAAWWEAAVPGEVVHRGTLVVAMPRDTAELARFAERTGGFEWVDEAAIAALEPALAGRFRSGLFFPGEAHLDPRRALTRLRGRLEESGVHFVFGADAPHPGPSVDRTVDCTGSAAIGAIDRLRGVRGEMLMLQTSAVDISRPVRLLHPRTPIYVVPRDRGRLMVGATMIESDAPGPPVARSIMELLNAAYALLPALGEARLIETGAGVRPAFPDNMPRLVAAGDTLHVNGLYRHGFLLAPAVAGQAAAMLAAARHRPLVTPITRKRSPALR